MGQTLAQSRTMRRGYRDCVTPMGSATDGGWSISDLFASPESPSSPAYPPAPSGPSTGPYTTPTPSSFRPGNWDFVKGEYTIAQGDTMWGIATTYLGMGNRWLDIWQMQEKPVGSKTASGAPYLNRFYNKPDPSSKNPGRPFMAGDVLILSLIHI